jgi:hypothetical protein
VAIGKLRGTVSVLMLLVSFSADAQRSDDAGVICYKLQDHASQRECLASRSAASAKELEGVEERVLNAFASWDQQQDDRARSLSLFADAKKRFEAARSSQCEFEASLSAGGNSQGDRRYLCEIEMNLRRSRDLRDVEKDLRSWSKDKSTGH